MQRKVFRGVGAMIVNPGTHRRFQVITKITDPQEYDFHPRRAIEVDLGRTPSRTEWKAVGVDDRGIDADRKPLPGAACASLLTGFHVTSLGGFLGPDRDDLGRGCLVGAVYLEDNYFEQVRDRIDLAGNPWPCDGRKTYQLTSITYSNAPDNGARKNLRYHGFEARLTSAGSGSERKVELFGIFEGNDDNLLGEFDLDFANPFHVDDTPELAANEQALTTVSQLGERGAVFVELAKLASFGISNPKLPIGLED